MQRDHTNAGDSSGELLSYWQKTSTHPSLSTDLPRDIDVAVIGGGLLGVSTCYWLARAGVEVALLERTALVHGATGRNGGFVTVGTAEPYADALTRLGRETSRDVLTLTIENKALVGQVVAEEGIACHYREPGNLELALSETQLAGLKRTTEALRADGLPAMLLDRTQAQEFVNTPLGPEIVGGKFLPGLGLVHSAKLILGVAEAAQRYGARMYQATALRLEAIENGVLIHTSAGIMQSGAVVVALNAWTSELLPVLDEVIVPVRGQVVAYAPVAPVFPTGMQARVSSTGEYWQQTVDGSIVLGGGRAVEYRNGMGIKEIRLTEEVQAAIEQVFPRLFPALSGLKVAQRWAGLMAFTPDYIPVADRVPDVPGAWVVGGFSGFGMPFGLRLGQLLATAVTNGDAPAQLQPFRLARPTLQRKENENLRRQ
ncbi:MAG TPA: FAD-binding oxidoreductase [Ktedonobacteraceae bacterium]|nr:FAD-binding oxidoreductase [Ktedonobacteraceae bacterium]